MQFVNTPEEQFANLDGYPFEPHYYTFGDGMRMHYLDEGPSDAQETMLLMHGEPSWSYLYRKMIPVFVEAGFRCLAPDLIGFGKSSKPTDINAYTYRKHIEWTQEWLDHVDPKQVTFFGQDWGGLIGLRLVTGDPDRFSRVVVGNTGLPTGDHVMPEAFLNWQTFSQKVKEFPIVMVIDGATVSDLPQTVLDSYLAPHPTDDHMAGARVFPALVPTGPDDPESAANRHAWTILAKWDKPLLTLFSDSDPITKGGEAPFKKMVPGAKGQPHQIIEKAGHFLQEDKGEEIAKIIVDWMS